MPAVEMKNITKRFGSLVANDSVTFSVAKGEIHALVGENGAGKSTLMNVLYGFHRPDSGTISIDDSEQHIQNPSRAIRLGIGMVHQHFMLIPPLTVTENIILGKEPTKGLNQIDLTKAHQEIESISQTYHLQIDPDAVMASLSVGIQQRVEILKILYRNANILILDEPTAVLTPQEVEELFRTLTNLKQKGKTVILITHKLNEVMAISDTVTVMSHGKVVDCLTTATTSQQELAQKMIGRELQPPSAKKISSSRHPLLIVDRVSVTNERNLPVLKNISLTISGGEILGIAGVEGNGQSELVETVTGLRKPSSGTITITGNNSSLLDRPAHIPEDRHKRGLVLDFSITENLLLGRQREQLCSNAFGLNRQYLDDFSDQMIEQYDIRPAKKEQLARMLSGGNQQKIVIARELSKNSNVIVASQPTRGLDIGAIEYVHNAILNERNKGKAVLLVSSELTELLTLSDRIAVMFGGEIVGIVKASETNERELGLLMTGTSRKSA